MYLPGTGTNAGTFNTPTCLGLVQVLVQLIPTCLGLVQILVQLIPTCLGLVQVLVQLIHPLAWDWYMSTGTVNTHLPGTGTSAGKVNTPTCLGLVHEYWYI